VAASTEDEPFEEALFEAPGTGSDTGTDTGTGESAEEAPRKQTAKSSRGRGRASVPSWDEIMFGTPKD
jgi:hypothetical protein